MVDEYDPFQFSPFMILYKFKTLWLCLVPRNFEGKCKRKKIERKKKKEMKIELNQTYFIYLLLQTLFN